MLKKYAIPWMLAIWVMGASPVFSGPPPIPCRVGGNLTVNSVVITSGNDVHYKVFISREDGTLVEGAGTQSIVGADKGVYWIDVPVYDAETQPWGLKQGERMVLHVHNGCEELTVISQNGGFVTMGESGEMIIPVNIEAVSGLSAEKMYTKAEVDAAVRAALSVWDIHQDGRIGIEEAIHALQVIAGHR